MNSEKKRSAPEKIDKKFFEEYRKLLRSLEMKLVYLKEARYRYLVAREEMPSECALSITTSKRPTLSPQQLKVDCKFTVIGRVGEEPNFQIDGTFCIQYALSIEPSQQTIDFFCNNHFTTHVWPFIRAFLQDAAHRMELGPIVLPLSGRHLPEKKGKEKKKQ